MQQPSIPGGQGSRIESYYFQTDVFARPIHIRFLSDYHTVSRAREALEAAMKGVKVVRQVEPEDGLSYMDLPGVFDERGAQVKVST